MVLLKDTAIRVHNSLKELIARGPGHLVLAVSSRHEQVDVPIVSTYGSLQKTCMND